MYHKLFPMRQWFYGNSSTWENDVLLHTGGNNEPKSAQQVNHTA